MHSDDQLRSFRHSSYFSDRDRGSIGGQDAVSRGRTVQRFEYAQFEICPFCGRLNHEVSAGYPFFHRSAGTNAIECGRFVLRCDFFLFNQAI